MRLPCRSVFFALFFICDEGAEGILKDCMPREQHLSLTCPSGSLPFFVHLLEGRWGYPENFRDPLLRGEDKMWEDRPEEAGSCVHFLVSRGHPEKRENCALHVLCPVATEIWLAHLVRSMYFDDNKRKKGGWFKPTSTCAYTRRSHVVPTTLTELLRGVRFPKLSSVESSDGLYASCVSPKFPHGVSPLTLGRPPNISGASYCIQRTRLHFSCFFFAFPCCLVCVFCSR